MKAKLNLDTDDYLIVVLLLIGALIAAIGIYTVGNSFVEWLQTALSNTVVR